MNDLPVKLVKMKSTFTISTFRVATKKIETMTARDRVIQNCHRINNYFLFSTFRINLIPNFQKGWA